jgi:uncharacterized protein YndB with AHSA1/START domain
MAMEKARPRRSGSAAARFARSRRAQTGEQVLTSTRRAMNSSPQTRHGNTTPPPRPGSHTIPETTTVEERAALGALIARYRHAVLVYCRISVTAVNPNTPLHGTSVRTRGPAEELRYRLDRAVEGSTAGLPTMDELTTPQNFELVESWRRAAQASGSQRARLPGRTLVGNVDRPTVPDGSQGRGRGHPGPCRPRPAVQEHRGELGQFVAEPAEPDFRMRSDSRSERASQRWQSPSGSRHPAGARSDRSPVLLELGAAMASFENAVTIRRPVEDVFAFLADFENVPKWNYAIVETTKVSPGPAGVGTTDRQIRSAPSRSEEAFEVTVFEPASRLEVQGRLGPFTARVSYLLKPTGSGTRLTNTVDLGSSGLLTLVAPVATSRVKHAVAANLDTLKQLLEGWPT